MLSRKQVPATGLDRSVNAITHSHKLLTLDFLIFVKKIPAIFHGPSLDDCDRGLSLAVAPSFSADGRFTQIASHQARASRPPNPVG